MDKFEPANTPTSKTNKPFKIVFMGSQEFSIPTLERLTRGPHYLQAVVTRPDRPAGRGRKMKPTPVKVFALKQGLAVLEPESVRDPQLKEHLNHLNPDFIVVAAYGGILPPSLLNLPRLGCLGVHPSLLPLYRGPNPIRWALINGERKTGVTIFLLNEGIDTGKIILKKEEPIELEDNAESLEKRLAITGAEMLIEALEQIAQGTVHYSEQQGPASDAPFISPAQEQINWVLPAETILNWIRGLSPHPGAYTHYQKKRLKILKAQTLDGNPNAPPGTIIETLPHQKGVRIACGKGILEPLQVQLEGAKITNIQDFLRGHPLKAGEAFTSVF